MEVPTKSNDKNPKGSPKKVVKKKGMENFPIVGENPKDNYPNMEKFPIIDKEPEDKEHEYVPKKKSHKLRNWLIGLSLFTIGIIAGDYSLQNAVTNMKRLEGYPLEIRLVTTYEPGRGWKHLGWDLVYGAKELCHEGAIMISNVVRLEERVAKVKDFTNYDGYKTLYHIGGGVAGGILGTYFLIRRKKK